MLVQLLRGQLAETGGSDGKESVYQGKRHRFDSCIGEDPLEEEMATHSSILAWKSHEQRSLAGYSPWDHKSWT